MSQNQQTPEFGQSGQPRPQTGPTVDVTVDATRKPVHRGSHLVSEFKELVGVDASLALDQVIDGRFDPLDDSARIVIKGGETFVSHVRTGGSA